MIKTFEELEQIRIELNFRLVFKRPRNYYIQTDEKKLEIDNSIGCFEPDLLKSSKNYMRKFRQHFSPTPKVDNGKAVPFPILSNKEKILNSCKNVRKEIANAEKNRKKTKSKATFSIWEYRKKNI